MAVFAVVCLGRSNAAHKAVARSSLLLQAKQALQSNDFYRLKANPGPWVDFVPKEFFGMGEAQRLVFIRVCDVGEIYGMDMD